MRKNVVTAAVSTALCLSFARAQPQGFPESLTEIRRAAAPSLDELLDKLRRSGDRQEQSEILDALSLRAAALDSADQARLIAALRDVSSSGSASSEIRGKALDTIGKSAAWFKDDSALKQAVLALAGVAAQKEPGEMASYKSYALTGLARLADRLPRGDQSLEETVIAAALDCHGGGARERLLSLAVLQKYLASRGSGVLYDKPELLRRVDAEIVNAIEGDVEAWASHPEHDRDYRYLMMRCLHFVAYTPNAQPDGISQRIREIFVRLSQVERDGYLRDLARAYAQAIPG